MSGWYNYRDAFEGLSAELQEAITPQDARALADDLRDSGGAEAFLQWCQSNRGDIEDFLSRTPARRNLRRWQDPVINRRLHLAAIWQCRLAHNVAKLMTDCRIETAIGDSYRGAAVSLGSVPRDHRLSTVTGSDAWPWEDEVPSPFSVADA